MLPRSRSGVPKMIFMPEVHSAQTVHLSCAKTNTISKRTETSFHLTYISLEYHSGVPKAISMPEVHSSQTMHLSYARLTLPPNGPTRASTRLMTPRSTIGCAQNDFYAHGTFSTYVYLCFVEINTICKRTETSFLLTNVTYEYDWVCPK